MHNRIHLGASKDANRKLMHSSYSHLFYGKNIKQPSFVESFPFDTWNNHNINKLCDETTHPFSRSCVNKLNF